MEIYSTIVKFFQDGGLFMYPIAIVFVLGVAIGIRRIQRQRGDRPGGDHRPDGPERRRLHRPPDQIGRESKRLADADPALEPVDDDAERQHQGHEDEQHARDGGDPTPGTEVDGARRASPAAVEPVVLLAPSAPLLEAEHDDRADDLRRSPTRAILLTLHSRRGPVREALRL